MKILAIDVGGTNVKMLAAGQAEARRFASGPTLTPHQLVSGVQELCAEWSYEAISIGYPGVVMQGRIVADPENLAPGWLGFDFAAAFGRPVKLINDAAMQALGSYRGGRLLFLGFGTGLGSALVVDEVVVPLELAHLSYKRATYEDYVGLRGLTRMGKKKWRRHVADSVSRLIDAFLPDDVVLGGGNAKKLKEIPAGCRLGDNTNAFLGGARMWDLPGEPCSSALFAPVIMPDVNPPPNDQVPAP